LSLGLCVLSAAEPAIRDRAAQLETIQTARLALDSDQIKGWLIYFYGTKLLCLLCNCFELSSHESSQEILSFSSAFIYQSFYLSGG